MHSYMPGYKTLKAAALAVLAVFICTGIVLASGETVNVNIGSLPAGKSITIYFDVTVDRNLPLTESSVQQQGLVSGANFTNVSTDDPDTVSAADPTETAIDSIPPVAGFGSALDFNGSNQYLEVPDGGTSLYSADYTIEAWVKLDTVRASTLIFRTDAAAAGHSNALYIDGSGRFVHYTYDTAGHTVTGTTTVEADRWYHVAGTVSANTMRLYVNGIEEGTAVSGLGALWNGGDRYLAAYGTGTLGADYLDGQLDEVRIWNTGLPRTMIEAWMFRGVDVTHPNEANLSAWYAFDEPAGTTAEDSAGTHDGTIMNGTLRVASGVIELYTDEDTAVGGMFVGSDEDGTSANGTNWAPSVSFEVVSATKGTVTLGSANSFTYTPDLNQNGEGTIIYKMFDGTVYSNDFTTTVHIAAVNDAPSITAPGTVAVTEDMASALTGILFSDADAGSSSVTATFSVPSGSLAAISGGGVSVTGSGSGSLTLSGTIPDINAFIAASNVTFTTALNATANVTLTVTIDDGGNTGSGGSKSDTTTVTLAVAAVNDGPTISAPGSIGVTEDVAAAITGISFSDVDAGGSSVTATFSVPSGSLAATGGGGVTVTGSGSGSLTLSGTIPDINAFIAASNVTFTTALNATANVTLTVTIDDGGNTGSGGSKSASATVTLAVTAVNDAPVLSPIGNRTVDELVALSFTAAASDPEGNTLVFSLDPGAPAGASIGTETGTFTWTPTEAQGPGVYPVTIRVTDNGTPSMSASETISITVNEVCTSASLTVTSADDAGDGTLRQALPDLCDGGVISFAIPGEGPHSIVLTSGELQITKNLTISGPGAAGLTISGGGLQRVFSVGSGISLVLRDLTVSAGSASSGAGLLNNGGAVTINSCEFTSCASSGSGGAVYNQSGDLTITNSAFSGNTALNGGALFNELGSASITNSTVSGNTASEPATGAGGGIFNSSGTLTLVNSTISGNSAAAAGGIHNGSGTVTLKSSIVAGNTAGSGPDLGSGTFVSEGYNLIQNSGAATITGPATADIYSQDPVLGPLQANGGPTRTMAILAGSPAINAVPAGANGCGTAITTDQRSMTRPQGTSCDIGAYEFAPDTTTALTSSLNPSVYGNTITFTATVSENETGSNPAGTVTFRDNLADIAACAGVSLSAGSASCSLGSLTGGLHSITAEYSGDGSFSGSLSNTVTQNVNRADQEITFDPLSDMPAGTAPFTLSASAGEGLVVSFETLTAPVCTVSGSTITLTHLAGQCTIRATQGGDTNYNAAAPVNRSFSVTPAALDHIVINPANAAMTAGGSQSYTAEGFDLYNNSLGDITGTTSFSMAPDGSCSGSSCSAIVSGPHTVTGSSDGKNAAAALAVTAGPATSFSISSPAGVTGGLAFTLTVTAKDAFDNTVTGYSGSVHFGSSDATATLPADYTFVAGDNGVRTFASAVTLNSAGIQTVSAADTLNAAVTGTATITVDLLSVAASVVSGNGTIACSPSSLSYGDGFTCTLCPATGYDLNRVYDNGANRTSSCTVDGNCYAYAATAITTDHVVKAAYLNYPVIILFGGSSDCFTTLQSAVNTSQSSDRIQAQGLSFRENLAIDRPGVAASLEGGYDPGFTLSTGHTVINGSLTIIDGTISVQDITIR